MGVFMGIFMSIFMGAFTGHLLGFVFPSIGQSLCLQKQSRAIEIGSAHDNDRQTEDSQKEPSGVDAGDRGGNPLLLQTRHQHACRSFVRHLGEFNDVATIIHVRHPPPQRRCPDIQLDWNCRGFPPIPAEDALRQCR